MKHYCHPGCGHLFGQAIRAVEWGAQPRCNTVSPPSALLTHPDLHAIAVANGGGLGVAPATEEDLETIELARVAIQAINSLPDPPAGCGRQGSDAQSRALCFQRAVLVALEFMEPHLYGSGGKVGVAAIKRMQAAIGVKVDGDWGPETNKRLGEVVGLVLTTTAKRSPAPQPGPPVPHDPGEGPAPGPKPEKGGGFGLLALVGGAAALWAASQS